MDYTNELSTIILNKEENTNTDCTSLYIDTSLHTDFYGSKEKLIDSIVKIEQFSDQENSRGQFSTDTYETNFEPSIKLEEFTVSSDCLCEDIKPVLVKGEINESCVKYETILKTEDFVQYCDDLNCTISSYRHVKDTSTSFNEENKRRQGKDKDGLESNHDERGHSENGNLSNSIILII